jgi:hypothetical protein
VLPGFRLRVRFNDGAEGTVEMAEFINSPAAGVFAALQDENLFRQAKIVLGAVYAALRGCCVPSKFFL